MAFLEEEARRDLEMHGRVLSMDTADFGAHSVGFFKRADQWLVRHSTSQPRAPSPPRKDADMSPHVFAVDLGVSNLSTAMTSSGRPNTGVWALAPISVSHCAGRPAPFAPNRRCRTVVASDRRAGGSASRPFWSWSARPGSQLRALPMQGLFP